MSAKAKGKAKAKATATRLMKRARAAQLSEGNQRQKKRRAALRELNALTEDIGFAAAALAFSTADNSRVEQRVRALQRRCPDAGFKERLHAAAKLYVENGGKFSVDLMDEEGAVMEMPLVSRHRVLKPTFRLKSQAFMLTFHSATFTADAFVHFQPWVKERATRLGCRAWAACLEQGTTETTQDKYHLHAYFYWNDGVGVDLDTTDMLVFAGVRPRVDTRAAQANQMAAKVAAYHGLWYVSVLKLGTVHADTNFHAWKDYAPSAPWADGLWSAGKLSHDQYLSIARQFRIGYSSRRRDVLDVMRDELEASISKHIEAEKKDLRRLPSRPFAIVDEFVGCFAGPGRWRRPWLVLVAPTGMGKSMLGQDVLSRIGGVLGVPGYLEITVEGGEHLDLGEYSHEKHAGILLDGVGDVLFLQRHREVLQGRPKRDRGGKSSTMMYAYPFTLCRRAVVVTMDLSAENLDMLKKDHWLSDPRNVKVLELTSPAWADGPVPAPMAPAGAPAPPVDKRAAMIAWPVAGVVAFLENADLAGPAKVLFANGVNGQDLAEMTSDTLQNELRLSAFAARKVLRARDAYF